MQIGPTINTTPTLPAAAGQNLLQANVTAANGAVDNTVSATDATGAQFSTLLATNVKPVKADDADTDSDTVTPTGDVASPSNVAVPLPAFIDQPIVQNIEKPDASLAVASTAAPANKQLIFSEHLPSSRVNIKNAVAASEAADENLDAAVADKEPAGKIALAQTAQVEQDPEFAKAVANIIAEPRKTIKANLTDVKVAALEPASNNTNQVVKADDKQLAIATETKAEPAAALTKISAKVLGVKSETVDGDGDADATVTPSQIADLKDFASMLKTKSFSEVKVAHEALQPSPVDQIQVKMSQAVAEGTNNIKINLHPMELGSINVDMDVDHEGNTKINITADKVDTLNMLKNDSHNLTKTLAEAGIKADSTNMQFNLRDGGQMQQQQQRDFGSNNFQQNHSNSNQQQASNTNNAYSRFTTINAQTLTLSANRGLNILV